MTGGHAHGSVNMSLKVRGRNPGVIKSVVHTLQLPPGQTLQGCLHHKQRRMQASNALIATYLISAVSERRNNSSTKSNPDAPPPLFFEHNKQHQTSCNRQIAKNPPGFFPPLSFCQGAGAEIIEIRFRTRGTSATSCV